MKTNDGLAALVVAVLVVLAIAVSAQVLLAACGAS